MVKSRRPPARGILYVTKSGFQINALWLCVGGDDGARADAPKKEGDSKVGGFKDIVGGVTGGIKDLTGGKSSEGFSGLTGGKTGGFKDLIGGDTGNMEDVGLGQKTGTPS